MVAARSPGSSAAAPDCNLGGGTPDCNLGGEECSGTPDCNLGGEEDHGRGRAGSSSPPRLRGSALRETNAVPVLVSLLCAKENGRTFGGDADGERDCSKESSSNKSSKGTTISSKGTTISSHILERDNVSRADRTSSCRSGRSASGSSSSPPSRETLI